jgi:hypothetical protein
MLSILSCFKFKFLKTRLLNHIVQCLRVWCVLHGYLLRTGCVYLCEVFVLAAPLGRQIFHPNGAGRGCLQ